jgi:hypothetical protein
MHVNFGQSNDKICINECNIVTINEKSSIIENNFLH